MNIVNKVTIKHLKENKKRTLVTIIGVIISIAMITGVITLGLSFSKLFQERDLSTSGYWHVMYKDINKTQAISIKNDSNTKDFIINKDLGYSYLKNSENKKKPYLFFTSFNKQGLINFNLKLKQGRLPKTPDEVVISSTALSNKEFDYKIGDTLNVDIGERYINSKKQSSEKSHEKLGQNSPYIGKEEIVPTLRKEFIIVGIIEKPESEKQWSPGYTVISYVDESTLKEDDVFNVYTFQNKLKRNIYDYTKDIRIKNNIKYENVEYNSSVLEWAGIVENDSPISSLYSIVGIFLVIVILGSVLLIYNSFAISVSERSRYLGMLSSIGATKKQKRNSVLFEGLIIGLISIPIGILSGIIGIWITFLFVNPLLKATMNNPVKLEIVVSPLGIILSILFSIITIYISAFIPSIKASKVTAIEAIRQSKDIKLTRRKVKTSKITRKIFGIEGEIALKNIKRNKGKYRITIFSLVVSIILFLTVSTFSFYTNKSLSMTNENTNYDIKIRMPIASKDERLNIYNKFLNIDEVKEYSICKTIPLYSDFSPNMVPDFMKEKSSSSPYNYYVDLVLMDDKSLESYAKSIGENVSKLNDINNPQGIVISTARYYDQVNKKYIETEILNIKKGDSLTLKGIIKNESKNITKINVLSTTKRLPVGVGYSSSSSTITTVMSEKVFKAIVDKNYIGNYINPNNPETLFLKCSDASKAQKSILSIKESSGSPDLFIFNKAEIEKKDKQIELIVSIFVYGFIGLISAISIANIFNTISTSISLRKKEFAMLKSIGMTPKSFNKMINYESIFYGLKSLLYGLPLSFIIMILLYKKLSSGFDFEFTIPFGSVLICILGVFVFVSIAMAYGSSKVRKENIIDALKQDNI